MISNSQLNEPFKVSLEFETSPTYGVLYRRLRDAVKEREAAMSKDKVLNPVLFREVRDLKNMMQLLRSAFETTLAQWEPREADRPGETKG